MAASPDPLTAPGPATAPDAVPGVVIVDYGAGNLRSVTRALEAGGARPRIVERGEELAGAAGVVLPGVGSAADAIAALESRGLAAAIREVAAAGVPLLGICLGQQLLFDWSAEGDQACLGILPGTVQRLPAGLTVPHMGWNQVERTASEHPFVAGLASGTWMYFVHSYVVHPADQGVVAAETDYGVRFPAIVARGNVMATQFHPEKSGPAGLGLYRAFLDLVRASQGAAVRA